ncbi:MAG TPA: hypothetical protein VME44_21065 [Streptosporangiaceae bacterium]|nr:hypothetical protein [Streptosporangiaceae bacterium]
MLPSDRPGGGADVNQHPAAADDDRPGAIGAAATGSERAHVAAGPATTDRETDTAVAIPSVQGGAAKPAGMAQQGGPTPQAPARKAARAFGRPRALVATALAPVTTVLAPVATVLAPVTRRRPRLRSAYAVTDGAPRPRSADVAGAVFARLTVLPALILLAWLIPGLPLLLGDYFLPVPMLLISVPLIVALSVNGLRVVPVSWPRLLSADRTTEPGWTVWFGLLATVAIVAGLTGWQLTERSEALIVLRDPGVYLQAGYWLAQHGSLPIPEMAKAFGAAHPGLNFASSGFLARGGSLYPAATPGLPLLLAGAFWVHGISAATVAGPVLGGLATLAFAGLVGRLVGPQWAPAGALVLGLTLPQQYVGRTSLSETALQIMLFGGLCLLADSLALRVLRAPDTQPAAAGPPDPANRPDGTLGKPDPDETVVLPNPIAAQSRFTVLLASARRLAWAGRLGQWLTPQRLLAVLAGLSLGFGLLISLDAIIYLIPVIPFGCALVMGGRPQAAPFLVGSLVGIFYGLLACYLLDRPFIDTVGQTVALAGVVAVWLIALCCMAFQLGRIKRVRTFVPKTLARRPLRWLPEACAVLTIAAFVWFAVRPYVQTVRGHPGVAERHFIGLLQRLQGLPLDPTRLYSEQTLYWVIWYIGLPTVLLGAFGLALVVRRCVRALLTWRDPKAVWREWGLPLAVIAAGSAVVLWYPDIVPDQPWSSRRLIVMTIPGLIIFALWAASWLARRARDRGARPATAGIAGVFCVAAMLVPTISTTFGVGLTHSGKSGGLTPVAQGLARSQTGAGEISAVADLCAQIPANASVVIVGWTTASQFSQVIRGMCGVPVAWMAGQPVTAVNGVIGSISAAGRRPVLLAGTRHKLAGFGGAPVRVLNLITTEDPHDLTQLPTAPQSVHYQVWMTEPSGAGVRT